MMSSYLRLSTVWSSGCVIYVLLMAISFLGYVLPYGQMSFWGATVITNLFSIISCLMEWVVGAFVVGTPTLERFMVFHFVLPFIVIALMAVHIMVLHYYGSSNPLGLVTFIHFYSCIIVRDLVGAQVVVFVMTIQIYFNFIVVSHPDNALERDPMRTPLHIVPEWYFLGYYAILKLIPDKGGGLLLMVGVVVGGFCLAELIYVIVTLRVVITGGQSLYRVVIGVMVCALMTWIGAQAPILALLRTGRALLLILFS